MYYSNIVIFEKNIYIYCFRDIEECVNNLIRVVVLKRNR